MEKEQRMRSAAAHLCGPLGSYARGWVNGLDGGSAIPRLSEADPAKYEEGWIDGDDERLKRNKGMLTFRS